MATVTQEAARRLSYAAESASHRARESNGDAALHREAEKAHTAAAKAWRRQGGNVASDIAAAESHERHAARHAAAPPVLGVGASAADIATFLASIGLTTLV